MSGSDYTPLGRLRGKAAPVTGAGKGIGRVIARMFVAEGAKVLVSDFSGEEATPPDIRASLSARAMLGRGGLPEKQAKVALFLASDLSSFVTGVSIPVDGVWTARLA